MNAKQILRKLLESSSRKKLQEQAELDIKYFLQQYNLPDGWTLYYPMADTEWIEDMVRTLGLDSEYGAQIYGHNDGIALYLPPDKVDKNDRVTVKDILAKTVRYLNRKYRYKRLWDDFYDGEWSYAMATAVEEPFISAETLDNRIVVDYETGKKVEEEW